MHELAESQVVLLRGEVVEVTERAGRRFVTVALEPSSLVASNSVPEDTHLGDRVRVQATIWVNHVAPELPAERRTAGRHPERNAEEE